MKITSPEMFVTEAVKGRFQNPLVGWKIEHAVWKMEEDLRSIRIQGRTFANLLVDDVVMLSGQHASIRFDDCTFQHCMFRTSWLRWGFGNCYFRDDVFEDCTLTGSIWESCTLESVSFQGSLTNLCRWEDCDSHHVEFVGGNSRGSIRERCRFDNAGKTPHAHDRGAFLMLDHDSGNSSWRRSKLGFVAMHSTNLKDCGFEGAILDGVEMEECKLDMGPAEAASLKNARLTKCNFTNTKFTGTVFRGSVWHHCKTRYCDFSGADFAGAMIWKSRFVDPTGRGESAILESTFILDSDVSGLIGKEERRKAYGKAERLIGRLQRVEKPISVGKFKEMYKDAFEAMSGEFQGLPGKQITPDFVERMVQKYGFNWIVTATKYTATTQRLWKAPNDVLQLNLDITALSGESERDKDILSAIAEMSRRSGHPVRSRGELFTVGWVRYGLEPRIEGIDQAILIEEVQSDVHGVRYGLKDPEFRRQLKEAGLEPQDIDRVVTLLEPFATRFYTDAISLIFQIARDAGYGRVEMLTYQDKQKMGSPESVYSQLPRSMGMRKEKHSVAFGDLREVWAAVPNRRTR